MSACKTMMIISRGLCTTSARSAAMVKPPVPVFGVDGRYATALYSAASKQKKMDAVEKDLNDLKTLMIKDAKLSEFVRNPLLKVNVKVDALKKIFTKRNYSPLTINFLSMMAENGRLKDLTSVVDCFQSVMSNIRGEIICEIVSAKALDAQMLAEFEKTLKGFMKKNEKVLLQTKVDPSIIGGAVVTIGDKYIDMSIASKVKAYNAVLNEVV